jgi:hypothetical protein
MSELTCPTCGNTDGSKLMGVEVRGVYDGVLYWACMRCGERWNRWPTDHYLHARAEKYLNSPE